MQLATPVANNSSLEAFGLRLRDERLSLHLNQIDFGKLAGSSEKSQGAYEKGATPPTVAYLFKLRQHGVDIGYVLTGSRSDGSLGFEQELLFELFGKLSSRERGAVMSLVMELTGQTTTAAEIGAQARTSRETLHDRRQGYRSPIEESS